MEYRFYDGECFVTFNMLEVNTDKNNITVAISKQGKITVIDYPLLEEENGLYFEYGVEFKKIFIEDFEEV